MNKTLQAAIVSVLLMMGQGVAMPEAAMAQEAATQAYRIPAGDLDSALRQLQTRISSLENLAGKGRPETQPPDAGSPGTKPAAPVTPEV